ncbi:hypothetical protein HanIR_Chr08g0377041 [Helianthus annuus]|nr:hypothetical protein HanIR_Chr08g0377041 [Helianthus annuus]
MTTIFIIFVSFGGIFLLGLATIALCCLMKKWKGSKATEQNKMVHFDEHKKVHENIVQGPSGAKTVALTVDDDLHVDEEEECVKNEKLGKASTSQV